MGMIGSHYWRNKRHGLNKCDEGGREHCSDHADCCAVTACTYCLELEIYGEAIQYGVSNQADNHWTGTVGNVSFDMYWDRDYDTDECVLIVEANGEEVYRKSCYEGQSCRDSSDETAITVDYEDAVLRWIKHESRPLPHRIDPDTGCKVWFCGECECSCRELCVTVTDPEGAITKGELSDASYDDCDGPVWSGTVGDYELELALGWDIYNQCVLLVKVDGVEQDAVAVTGCKDLSATIVLYDGTTIEVACKICDCVDNRRCTDCCDGQHPAKDLYLTLIPLGDCCGDLAGTYLMAYQGIIANDLGECSASWRGSIAGCWIEFTCGVGDTILIDSCHGPTIWQADTLTFQGCNPFLVSWLPCAYESSDLISKLCTPTCTDVGSPCIEIHLHE